VVATIPAPKTHVQPAHEGRVVVHHHCT
jgi:hypothetical protein